MPGVYPSGATHRIPFEVNLINLFTVITNEARVFHFHPILIFGGTAGVYPSGATYRTPPEVNLIKLFTVVINISKLECLSFSRKSYIWR